MRKQIRGLTQATANAQDGISAVQTAEGALTEVHDMLQRMNELSIKASNGTMSSSDRTSVQNEIDQLVTEIDRVSETTKFNETDLLKGDDTTNGNSRTYTAKTLIGTTSGFTVSAETVPAKVEDGIAFALGDVGLKSSDTGVVEDVTGAALAAKIASGGADATQVTNLNNLKSITVSGSGGTVTVEVELNDGTKGSYSGVDFTTKFGLALAGSDGTTIFSKTLEDKTTTPLVTAAVDSASRLSGYSYGAEVKAVASISPDNVVTLTLGERKSLVLDLQVGADTTRNNKIDVAIESMSATSLGVSGLKVDGLNSQNADDAVNTIAAAIQKVSDQRSALGAAQNRLEHTIANLDNIVENTTAAESAIRDTDMATEMVRYSNNNILSQAGQSMLAQANQTNQGVLSLLG